MLMELVSYLRFWISNQVSDMILSLLLLVVNEMAIVAIYLIYQ